MNTVLCSKCKVELEHEKTRKCRCHLQRCELYSTDHSCYGIICLPRSAPIPIPQKRENRNLIQRPYFSAEQ